MKSFELPTARRSRKSVRARALGTLLAAVAVLALALTAATASAASSMTYQLRGYEVNADPATFVGFWQQGAGSGIWAATILHGQLQTGPNKATTITGGLFFLGRPGSAPTFGAPPGFTLSFSISPSYPDLTGLIDPGGRLVARPVVARPSLGEHLCTQSFLARGSLTGGGSFEGTLTHYGVRIHGACDVSSGLATFEGSVTVPTS
jgi:hypothetical protein